MLDGWQYRVTAAIAAALCTAFSAVFAFGSVTGADRATILAVVTAVAVLVGSLAPLYSPRPRRIDRLLALTTTRVAVGCAILATLGYAGVGFVPGMDAIVAFGVLSAATLPAVIWTLGRTTGPERVLVVGDDPDRLAATIRALPVEPLGFLSPVMTAAGGTMLAYDEPETTARQRAAQPVADGGGVRADGSDRIDRSTMADGSDRIDGTNDRDRSDVTVTDGGVAGHRPVESVAGVERLSGLSRLGHVLRERNVDTVAMAFGDVDREESFGVLRECHAHGVGVVVAESVTPHVLVRENVGDGLVAIDLEPWPWHRRAVKRAFDVAFAAVGLLVLAPVILAIAVAIRLDSRGPVFYSQERTAELGARFSAWKFRSMLPESEDAVPGDDDDRITRIGRVLRETHMDEIPQLFSILVGDMSVVGPRAAWTDEEMLLVQEVHGWAQRWHVKPGLTGLAQINHASSMDGHRKLEFDLEYVRRQSLGLDLRIVCTQLWMVLVDVVALCRRRVTGRKP